MGKYLRNRNALSSQNLPNNIEEAIKSILFTYKDLSPNLSLNVLNLKRTEMDYLLRKVYNRVVLIHIIYIMYNYLLNIYYFDKKRTMSKAARAAELDEKKEDGDWVDIDGTL